MSAIFTSRTLPLTSITGIPASTLGLLSDPLDKNDIVLRDDFLGGGQGSTSFGVIGEIGWSIANIVNAGASDWIPSVANHPGIYRLGTGVAANDGQVLTINYGPSFTQMGRVQPLSTITGWAMRFIARLTQTTLCALRFGVAVGADTLKPTNFIGWQYDTTDSDTNFSATCRSAGTETKTASSVAADTNWHVFDISSSVIGTMSFTIDGGTPITISTNVISTAANFFFQMGTRTTASKSADFDMFAFYSTISR